MALTDLTSVKLHLGIPGSNTSQDAFLTAMIAQVSALVQSKCALQLEPVTVTEYYSGNGMQCLLLNRRPVRAITSVHLDPDGYFGMGTGSFATATQLTEGVDFVLKRDNAAETEVSESGILIRLRSVWPSADIRLQGLLSSIPGAGIGNVRVAYQAGWASVPADLALLANQMVAQLKQSRQGLMSSENYEDYSYTRLTAAEEQQILGSVSSLLGRYRGATVI